MTIKDLIAKLQEVPIKDRDLPIEISIPDKINIPDTGFDKWIYIAGFEHCQLEGGGLIARFIVDFEDIKHS